MRNTCLLLTLLLATTGCFKNFYNTRFDLNFSQASIAELTDSPNQVVLHVGSQAFWLQSIMLSDSTLTGKPRPVAYQGKGFTGPDTTDGKHVIRFKHLPELKKQVHVFTLQDPDVRDSIMRVHIAGITRVQTYPYNADASTASNVLGILGIITLVGGFIIVANAMSNFTPWGG